MKQNKAKILCVDDEPGVLQSLDRLLKDQFEVLTANSPEEALKILDHSAGVAIILSDYRMPQMNGVDFLKAARLKQPHAVRALLSGQIDIHQISEAINRAEIHRFILKPWENEVLKIQMLEALQAHHSLEEKARLRYLAITDPVTGLTNHRFFQDKIREMILNSKNENFSLVMIDVDHFKSYNDRYGHPEGDRLLAEIADLIRQTGSESSYVSRYGGEEFAALLPTMDLGRAQVWAEQVRSRIESHIFAGPNSRRAYVTISLGLASFPKCGKTAEELITSADHALYQAKSLGRNQTAVITG